MSVHSDGRRLGQALVRWFRAHKRTLPWRTDRTPYRVWVSEVMLQQTRVDTVVTRYPQFLKQFPSVHDLAKADEDDVLKAWEGLGYYSRARNLRLAAREIVARYGGDFPEDPEQLQKLPGIGRYTAGAIAGIAFNRPVAAVDGNVLRVVSRLLAVTDPITKASVRRRIEETTAAMIPPGDAADFTEALMELGALVCTPGEPDCQRCPWTNECAALAKGIAAELPNRPKRRTRRIVTGAVAVVADGNRVLVTRRPSDGLLGGMWEFPWVETLDDASLSLTVDRLFTTLKVTYGVNIRVDGRLPDVKHVFSHLEWRLHVFSCRVESKALAPPEKKTGTYKWIAADELQTLAFGKAHRRIADAWLAGRAWDWDSAT